MNVFEDLVLELKEENLLESTVVEPLADEDVGNAFDETEVPNTDYDLPIYNNGSPEPAADVPAHTQQMSRVIDPLHDTDEPQAKADPHPAPVAETKAAPKRPADKEFFKKKAVGEVSSLQMVEHVITGVEREYLKVVPKPFDDFNAKKALNLFLNGDADVSSEEHAAAEFKLIEETESWCTALAARDNAVPVSALRQYCERSRPALSSQALLALGRFYRNLPYSEQVRSKFDFVMTRLFSRATGQEKRVCLFDRQEMLGHINTLYSDWSSIPLYDADGDESKVMLTALSFEDLAIEAENASNFDQLIENDFFGRLRMFKESISELFYAPQVTAAAIDCNIRIGNTYVDLIDRERRKLDSDSVQTKYGDHDLAVSEVTGKTLQLADLLRELESVPREDAAPATAPEPEPVEESTAKPGKKDKKAKPEKEEVAKLYTTGMSLRQKVRLNAFGVSKWVLIFAIVMICTSVGIWVWSTNATEETASTAGVRAVSLDNTIYKEYVEAARVSAPTFYVQMKKNWENLPREKKQDLLQKMLVTAQENGCTQVNVIGPSGRNAGYASATKVEIPIR